MNQDKLNELILQLKEQEPDFLEAARTMVNRRNTYVCPYCGNGMGIKGTGMEYDARHERWKCFSCGNSADVIDLAMKTNNLGSFYEGLRWCCNHYGIPMEENEIAGEYTPYKRPRYIPYEEGAANYETYLQNVEQWNDYKYLLWRGISVETQQRFHIGLDKEWVHPKRQANKTPTVRCIIPTSDYSYLARDVRKDNDIPEEQKSYTKMKVGQCHIWNIQELESLNHDYVFVVEGEIDGMSIEECGHPAVGLGSVGNKARLVDIWASEGWYKDVVFLIGDTDKSGQACSKYLETELKKQGCCEKVVKVKFPKGTSYKDPNEFLMDNRKWFKRWLDAVVQEDYRPCEVNVTETVMKQLDYMSKYYNLSVEDTVSMLVNTSYFQAGRNMVELLQTQVTEKIEDPDELFT